MNLPPLTGKNASALQSNLAAGGTSSVLQQAPPSHGAIATIAVALITGMIFICGYRYGDSGWSVPIIAAFLVLLLGFLGWSIVGEPLGALVNAQNIMSISRFQLVVWTVVVLASYLSFALYKIRIHAPNPLDFTIPGELLTLMGISAASFIGSPLILSTKKTKEPEAGSMFKAAIKTGESVATVDDNRVGTLYANTNASDARVTDMFQGDEIGNTTHIDLAKVQMFFFTFTAAIAYLLLVVHTLRNPGADLKQLDGLPALSDGIVTAAGISHAGYLGSKGLDHTTVQKPT